MYNVPRTASKETVEHLILRCAGRAASRRKYVGRVGDKTVEEAMPREAPGGTQILEQ